MVFSQVWLIADFQHHFAPYFYRRTIKRTLRTHHNDILGFYKYKAADNIKEWIGAEQMEEIYGMSKDVRCSFVHRHKIPSRVVYGKVQYSKDHIDIINSGGFDQREKYYSVTETIENSKKSNNWKRFLLPMCH